MTLDELIQANEARYNWMLHISSSDKELEICRQTVSALNICKYACEMLRVAYERTNDWCEVMKEAELE